MAESLTFSIYPDAETISLRLLENAIGDVRKLVRDVDYAVTRERGRRWIVAELHSSTPTITIRPAIDGSETVDVVGAGLRIVTTGQGVDPPPYFSAYALDDLKRMRRLFGGGGKARHIQFSSDGKQVATVDNRISERVDRIQRGTYVLLGSAEGMLDAVNLHGAAKTFTVWDRLTGVPVRCALPAGANWIDHVKNLLQRRVLVVGQVRYYSNGVPHSMSHLREVQDASPDLSLPKARFGCIPDLTGGEEPSKYLESMRE
jgi:hypothetical protein